MALQSRIVPKTLLTLVALLLVVGPVAAGCPRPTRDCPSVAELLDQREGFGRSAAGGFDGVSWMVTSSADDGPGSLREALRVDGTAKWITFASDMTITLASQLVVPSNVTIDGRGHGVVLQDYGFGLYRGVGNIIITHLTVDGRFRTVSQAVNLSGGVHDIWLDHLDLSRFVDRLVNVKRGSTDVTMSWIRFHDHNKVMLLNNEIGANLFAEYERDANSRVTIHHSYFLDTVQRNPRAQFGIYQIYNNLLENWDFYGMSFGLEAKALVQGNIFVNDRQRTCTEQGPFDTVEGLERSYCHGIRSAPERAILPNGSADQKRYEASREQFGYTRDFRAFLKLRNNLFVGSSSAAEDYRPELAPDLPHCSTYRDPDDQLTEAIRRGAGNTATPALNPSCDAGRR